MLMIKFNAHLSESARKARAEEFIDGVISIRDAHWLALFDEVSAVQPMFTANELDGMPSHVINSIAEEFGFDEHIPEDDVVVRMKDALLTITRSQYFDKFVKGSHTSPVPPPDVYVGFDTDKVLVWAYFSDARTYKLCKDAFNLAPVVGTIDIVRLSNGVFFHECEQTVVHSVDVTDFVSDRYIWNREEFIKNFMDNYDGHYRIELLDWVFHHTPDYLSVED